MVEAADAIAAYVARGRAEFDADPAVRDAILYQIVVIGEAAKVAIASDPALAAHFAEVEWSPMARMRDRVVHRYWATDMDVVWDTAMVEVPRLRSALVAALERHGRQ